MSRPPDDSLGAGVFYDPRDHVGLVRRVLAMVIDLFTLLLMATGLWFLLLWTVWKWYQYDPNPRPCAIVSRGPVWYAAGPGRSGRGQPGWSITWPVVCC